MQILQIELSELSNVSVSEKYRPKGLCIYRIKALEVKTL